MSVEDIDSQLDSVTEQLEAVTITKADAKEKQTEECEALFFSGQTVGELLSWKGYHPSSINTRNGDESATVMVPGITRDDLRPLSLQLLQELKEEYENIPVQEVTEARLQTLAKEYDFLSGKWFFFLPDDSEQLEDIWHKLCKAAVNGKLPPGVNAVSLAAQTDPNNPLVKRQPAPGTSFEDKVPDRKVSFKITDFTCLTTRRDVLTYLKSLGYEGKVKLKADIYTALKIYSDNNVQIRPSIASVNLGLQKLAPSPAYLYKTSLCAFHQRGSCKFGDKCRFAHGKEELRKTN